MSKMGLHCSFGHLKTQVMAKRRAGSRTASLTSDHKKSGINPIYLASGGVPYIVEKLSTRATTLL
jgi:hypothetical protein